MIATCLQYIKFNKSGYFLNEIQENDDIVKKIDKFKEDSKKYRESEKEEKVTEALRFYDGHQWRDDDGTRRPKNIIFQMVESEVPLLVDPMPSTDIISKNDDGSDVAEVLQAAKDYVYREDEIFLKDVHSIRSALIVGQSYQYIDFDPDGENGEGSVTVKNLDWNQVYLDQACTSVKDSRITIIDIPISKDDLKRRFPKTYKKALNKPLKDIYNAASSRHMDEDQNLGRSSNSSGGGRFDSQGMTHIEECWLKDYTLIDIDDDETQVELTKETAELQNGINPDVFKWEDHPTHIKGHLEQKLFIAAEMLQIPPEEVTEQDIEALKESDEQAALLFNIIDDHIEMHQMHMENMDADEVGKKPKYPNNLRLVIKTGEVVHFDGSPDVEDGMIPLVTFYCYKGNRPYADGIVKNIIPMQKSINEMEDKEFRGLKVVGNPGWMVDLQSGVDADTLTDEDGIVVVKEQGTEVRRLEAGQVNPQLSARTSKEYEFAQRIEGVGETVLGEAPKHEMSGVSLRRLQQQSLGRIRLKSKMIESAIYRRDQLIISRIIKYWSTERKLRVEDGNGKYRHISFDPEMIRDFKYDLVLAPGTMAGMDNEAIYETYKELLIAGGIDLKTFLEVTNLPKKQVILDKLAETEETQAMMQQLQQENLMLKAQFAPEALSPEEIEQVQQMQSQ